MVTLSKSKEVQINRNSSKGNQLKWKDGDVWYKADYLGYEALAEYVVSSLLKKSNVKDFVEYKLEKINYNGFVYNGCKCSHFLKAGESLITLPRLFQMYLNEDIYMKCENPFWSEKECIEYVVNNVEQITRLRGFGKYLTLLLEMDAFFYNEDRHFHNIAVIYNEETDRFRYCPIFDNGGSLFSDTKMYYPIELSVDSCIEAINAKPFSPCFEDQVSAAIALYGEQFHVWFTEADLEECLGRAEGIYDLEILERVKHVIIRQMLKKGASEK